jgi:hypothetical protein
VLATAALGAALARRTPVLCALFVAWGGVALLAFAVPSPFGENVTRLRYIVFPLMLLAASLTRFRPRALALAALAAALAYNVVNYVTAATRHADDRGAAASFWTPALAFLAEHATPDHRVEVVPTYNHWEAYRLPRAGYALARGWYRQLDLARNPTLYRQPLRAGDYRAWLRRMAVRFVLLPDTRLGAMVEEQEAELLRSGRSGLRQVLRSAGWTIYELPEATPLLPGGRVTELTHDRVTGWVPRRATYKLHIHYTPYWVVLRGSVTVARAADGTTVVRASSAGRFVLAVSLRK